MNLVDCSPDGAPLQSMLAGATGACLGPTSERVQHAAFVPNRLGRNLFVQATLPVSPAVATVVFCPPFGEERQKSYRAFFHLAQSLAERCIASFRFDYFGTGDSEGDFDEVTIDSMVADTVDVAFRARIASRQPRLYLAGTRFGASIAAIAAEQIGHIEGLLLLFPIVEGKRYWGDLLRQQQMTILGSGRKPPTQAEFNRQLAEVGYAEIESSCLNRAFVEQLEVLDLRQSPITHGGRIFIATADVQNGPCADLVARYRADGRDVRMWHDGGRDFWSLKSMYDYYIPLSTFDAVIEWVLS